MNTDIAKIIKEFAQDVIKEARKIMDSDVGINSKTGTNTLKGSDLYKQIDWSFREEGNDIIIDTLFNFYIVYVEWDRPPGYGKMPPIDTIVKWLKKKNIVQNNKNIRSVAFLIARAIQRDGWKGRPIFATLFDNVGNKWENEWSEKLFDQIIKDLTDYFN